ncbi:D-ribose pyranase, partial [Erysipelatoclostridium ramosum]|uniref:D-ribose pyranase n=1 Tax=Thomasclavelia ramosa TaxID=1547 RepID=UPI001D009DC3
RFELPLQFGQPSFMDVLEEVGADMKVEKIILAEEMKLQNPEILRQIDHFFAKHEPGFTPEIQFVLHSDLKKMTKTCKAVIRTGETTPYANIILQSGGIF